MHNHRLIKALIYRIRALENSVECLEEEKMQFERISRTEPDSELEKELDQMCERYREVVAFYDSSYLPLKK